MRQFIKKILTFPIPLRVISNKFNPVFLFHSLGIKTNFYKNIDHVNIKTLETQLKDIQKNWKFVSIDEYASAKSKKGLTSLTIDDGYKNVIDESLKVFENLKIPITIFINSSTFSGKIFWRDKVRYLIENKLIEKFLISSNLFNYENIKNFYYTSKDPKFNSIEVEREIDQFFSNENINISMNNNLCFDDKKYLIDHSLVSYGNHSANHYVLSSLKKEEQKKEIIDCQNFINKFKINKSNIFCIPFGGSNTYNDETLSVLKELNYKTILVSQNRLDSIESLNKIERFMPKTFNIKQTIKELYIKRLINR